MDIGSTLSGLSNSAVSLLLLIFAIVVVVAVIAGGLTAYFNMRRYKQFRIIIFEKDGAGNTVMRMDEGGVFVDKATNNKRLYLKKAGIGMAPDNIPYMYCNNARWVMVLRTGLKNFRYINIQFDKSLINFIVGEEDVNWALNVYEAHKKRFTLDWLQKHLPLIVIMISVVIMLVIFVIFMNKMGVLNDIAKNLAEVTGNLVQIKSGTTIIPK